MSPNSERQAETIKCPIWPDFQATVSFRDPDDGTICIISDRAGGCLRYLARGHHGTGTEINGPPQMATGA